MILLTQGKPTTCPLVDPLGSSQIRQTPTLTVVMLQIWGFVRVLQNEKRQGHVSVAHSTLSHLGFSLEWLQENPPSPSQSQSITENSREKKNIQTNKTKNQKKNPHKKPHTNKPTGGCESSPILCYEDENSSNSINFLYIKILSDNLLTTNPILKICLAFVLAILSFIVQKSTSNFYCLCKLMESCNNFM